MNSDDDNASELAKYNLSLVTDWVKYADSKATLLLTIAVTILGVSFVEIPLAAKIIGFCFDNNYNLGGWALILPHVVFYGAILCAIWKLLSVVKPNLIAESKKHSWFFFQSMSLLEPEDFHEFTKQLTNESAYQQLNDQIYNNSVVAREKFASIRSAYNVMVLVFISGLLAVLPVLIISSYLPVS